jgi:3-deoxy-7-phosphoheptulonate synthase
MILPKSSRLTTEQLSEVTAIVAEFGCKIQPIVGAVRTIYAIVGDERDELMINRLEGLDYIERIDRIQSPFKLMDRRSDLASHRIVINGVTLGERLFVIAGACTIDPKNPNYFYETAQAVKEAGADMLRGGVWKPRTNPYTFQGDTKSMDILLEASRRTGLPVDTEVMEEAHIKVALDAGVTCLQVGARNALDHSLLRAIGRAIAQRNTVVLLKRGMHMGPVSEFISAAEYIAAFGNPNVVLCPRGTAPTLDGYRNHPDESITPLLKEKTWAPVIVDPSHSVGKAALRAGLRPGRRGLWRRRTLH